MAEQSQNATILIVESDVLVRMPIANYLRECGYKVLEALDSDEAITVLKSSDVQVDVILANPRRLKESTGFDIAKWVRGNKPEVEVLFSGTPQRAAALAGDLCAEGPDPAPYHPQQLEQQIRQLMATRKK
jgi:DNA-binding response OmpR family regulator